MKKYEEVQMKEYKALVGGGTKNTDTYFNDFMEVLGDSVGAKSVSIKDGSP